jgi:ABC-type Zn2+ transport system substrate-binding protein/surface adhesin
VRRDLVVIVAVCSLLWAVTGVSVLALAVHQHSSHSEAHDHLEELQATFHGHAHESAPDHDHEFTAALSASRASAAEYSPGLTSHGRMLTTTKPDVIQGAASSLWKSQDYGPPSYLMNCVLLT